MPLWKIGIATAGRALYSGFMQPLDPTSAADYLRRRGLTSAEEPLIVRELSGGVSSVVLLVERPAAGERFVLKQALPRLRVEQEWLCSIERVWREVEVLRLCGELMKKESGVRGQGSVGRGQESAEMAARVPDVLWDDRENYCFAMTAAPAEHRAWKELLLAGEADEHIARACGRLLGRLHGGSWNDPRIARQLDDRTFFRDLRISPYFDRISQVHPDLAPAVSAISAAVWEHRCCLVHGDFSPKNLLVAEGELWLIDCEVGHYGDPAFDLGFFLTHLILKSLVWARRGDEYLRLIDEFRIVYDAELRRAATASEMHNVWQRTIGTLAGCLLARVDGKSPVNYLTQDLAQSVRTIARGLLATPPASMDESLSRVRAAISAGR